MHAHRQQPDYSAWEPIEGEMRRLHDAGYSLLPLGKGKQGKEPLVAYSKVDRFPIEQVLGLMRTHSSLMYGVRLPDMVVLDIDSPDEAIATDLQRQFGPAGVVVKTPGGRHLYYRSSGLRPTSLRREGLPVDVKFGLNAYVVGPGSIRPDGSRYVYRSEGRLGAVELSQLADTTDHAPIAFNSGKVPKGCRNKHLTSLAIRIVGDAADFVDLFAQLLVERDVHCEDPQTVPNQEVREIAEWSWELRLRNSVFVGRNSAFKIFRIYLDAIRQVENASDAMALYVTLLDLHGHQPGKLFSLVYEAMRKAGLTDLSRERFLAARRTLERLGLLKQVSKHIRRQVHAHYQLCRPVPHTIAQIRR